MHRQLRDGALGSFRGVKQTKPINRHMRNKIIDCKPESNKLGSYRKEKAGLYRQYTLVDLTNAPTSNNGFAYYAQPMIVRVYWPAQTAYACVWLNAKDWYAVGKGKAGGCGYCKESAAIDSALRDAGVTLEQSIHGAGTQAVIGAITAFAEFLGLTNWTITEAHA